MNPTHAGEVRAWMRAQGFEPSKSMGQNFLIDVHQRDFILAAANVTAEDRVLEVGPGLGVLTGPLLDKAARLVAVELDLRLAEHLRAEFSGRRNFELIHGDALRVDLPGLLAGGINRVVSNLPYSVGSRILFELAASESRPDSITVTVQREVADRLAAPIDGDDYGLLSVWMQMFYAVAVVRVVPNGCFLPPPRVESAVVHLQRLARPFCEGVPTQAVARVVKRAFEHRRKQMGTIFRKAPEGQRLEPEQLRTIGIEPSSRPEILGPEDFAKIATLPTH
jgi:16S rRNA (adenine1518-N6/adenine1519-N6)-dimethyltransferase